MVHLYLQRERGGARRGQGAEASEGEGMGRSDLNYGLELGVCGWVGRRCRVSDGTRTASWGLVGVVGRGEVPTLDTSLNLALPG